MGYPQIESLQTKGGADLGLTWSMRSENIPLGLLMMTGSQVAVLLCEVSFSLLRIRRVLPIMKDKDLEIIGASFFHGRYSVTCAL